MVWFEPNTEPIEYSEGLLKESPDLMYTWAQADMIGALLAAGIAGSMLFYGIFSGTSGYDTGRDNVRYYSYRLEHGMVYRLKQFLAAIGVGWMVKTKSRARRGQ